MREKRTRRFFAMDQNRRGRLRRANVGGSDDWNLASALKRKRTRESPSRDGSEGRRASSTRAAPRASRRVSRPLGFGRVYISSRARARAHLLLASRWFSAAFACPPPPAPRWSFPRGTTEGHFSCVAAPAARFPLPRFRAATARAGAESPRTVPSPRGTAADTRSVRESATARRGSAREGERMSGDAGNKFAVGETGNAKARVRFPGDSGYDVPPPASRRPRFGRSRSVGRSKSRGGRCPRMPLASASSDTPATSASASPSRPRQIRRVSRFGPAISREVGTRTGTRPELSRSSECAREERRRRTQRNGARLREGPFASVALARVRLCRLRCSFAALFGRNEETLSVCVAERRRARGSSNLGFPELLGGQTVSFRSVAQRRSYTTRVEARVVARPLRWVQALGRTAGAAVEAAVAATRRAKATWLRES